MKLRMKDLMIMIPNLQQLTASVIDVAYKLQDSIGDIDLKKVSNSRCSLWHSAVYVNDQTS